MTSREETSEACEHDWRADPAGYVYLSMPPKRKVVCASCGAIAYQSAPMPEPIPGDPKDWPKITEEELLADFQRQLGEGFPTINKESQG